MNKKQYNNVIEHTLQYEQPAQTDDSLATARAIFDNMGVALPQGDMKTVYETISTDNYMGWKSCTMQEAQAAANKGTAAIGISEDRIVVLSANDEEQPVAQTASVMTLDENTSAFAVENIHFYLYNLKKPPRNWKYYAQLVIENARRFKDKRESQIEDETDFSLADGGWCADFVRLCCYLAGVYIENVNIPKTSNPSSMKSWFEGRNRISTDFTKIQAGDILFTGYANGGIAHVCVATTQYDLTNGTVETINGNWSRSVKEVTFSHTALPQTSGQFIKCYAHPDYEAANN